MACIYNLARRGLEGSKIPRAFSVTAELFRIDDWVISKTTKYTFI